MGGKNSTEKQFKNIEKTLLEQKKNTNVEIKKKCTQCELKKQNPNKIEKSINNK